MVSCVRSVTEKLDASLPLVSSLTPQACSKNDRRGNVSEGLRRSIQAELRRFDLHQSRAGGIRTHDIRLLKHVLQLGSRSSVARPGIEPGTSR